MPVDLSTALPPVWSPTGEVKTNLFPNPSVEALSGTTEVRRNIVPNPNFETDAAGGWTVDASTIARSTAAKHSGVASLLVTPSVDTGGTFIDLPVTVGQVYTVSAWFLSPAARTAQIYVAAISGSGVQNLNAGEWTRISHTFTATVTPQRFYFSSQSTTGIFYLDDVLLEKAPILQPYFDGGNAPHLRENIAPNPTATPLSGTWATMGNTVPGSGVFTAPSGQGTVGYEPTPVPLDEVSSCVILRVGATPTAGTLDMTIGDSGGASGTVPGGVPVTASMWVLSDVAAKVRLRFRLVAGGDTFGPTVTLTPGVWQEVSATVTLSGRSFVTLKGDGVQVLAPGNYVAATKALAEVAPSVGTFFHGASGDVDGYPSAWNGAVNNSVSYLYSPDLAPSWTGTPNASQSILTGQTATGYASVLNAWAFSSTHWASDRSRSLRIVGNGVNADTAVNVGPLISGIINAPGVYTFIGTLRLTEVLTTPHPDWWGRLRVNFGGTAGSTVVTDVAPTNAPGVYEVRETITLVDGANVVSAYLYNGGVGYGEEVWWDSMLLMAGPYTEDFFDGSTTDDLGPGFAYDWTALPDESTSTRTALVATPADPDDHLFLANEPRPRGVLTSNRLSTFLFELLNTDDASQGLLDDVMDKSATITFDTGAMIKGGGSIEIGDMGHGIDWFKSRIKITRVVNGVVWGRGIWIPTLPTSKWQSDHRYWTVELHDKLVILDQDAIAEGLSYPAGTNVTATVRALIESTGEDAGAITDSDKTLANDMVWEAGTTKLAIINNMLDASGYYTLRMSGNGEYITEPYVPPANRPLRYEFVDGDTAIYLDTFDISQDIFFVPNRVIAIQQGDDTTEGMTAIAENNNPDSPYSFQNVGRWIVDVQTGVEATDQEALDTYAYSRLVDLSNPGATINIQVAPIPLDIYDAVRFRSEPAGIDGRFVVDRITDTLTPTGLMQVTLRAVVDL